VTGGFGSGIRGRVLPRSAVTITVWQYGP